MTTVRLPTSEGTLEPYELGRHPAVAPAAGKPRTRTAYAAVHVVADPLGDTVGTSAIDWDATMAFRHHLWSLGLGVAEAMDTAQRGMGLTSDDVERLIRMSIREAKTVGGLLACGITTDDLGGADHSLEEIGAAYLDQLGLVEEEGGSSVIMASRALARSASGPDDYASIYGQVISQAGSPVILHWLGPMFDPSLAGYWGSSDPETAMHSLVGIVRDNPSGVDGVKISMLDEDLEVEFRRLLPEGVRCYTGDDFNFPALIAGDERGHSDALLGIFDAIAPVAVTALLALDDGDRSTFDRLLAPTVPLSRHIFQTPTYHYKTGLVFLAYLAGHQDHFRMVGGQEGFRSIIHLAELVRLADAAGLLPEPDRVAQRLHPVLATAGLA